MIKKEKMKKQMLKRISALMLTATLCVSACPNVATGQELKNTETTQGVESPSIDNSTDGTNSPSTDNSTDGTNNPSTDNSEDETKKTKLNGLQILLNGTTITSNRISVKKGDTITVRAEIEGEVNENATFLSVAGEEVLVDLSQNEHGYFEGTAVCEDDLSDEGMLFYLNYTIYGSDGLLTKYYKEIGTDQEDNKGDSNEENKDENNTGDKTETSEIKIKDIQALQKSLL